MKQMFFTAVAVAMMLVTACSAQCPIMNGYDLNGIPTLVTVMQQLYQNGDYPANFTINLCHQESVAVRGCNNAAFITLYGATECQMFYDVLHGNSTSDGSLELTYGCSENIRKVAKVMLTCGSTLALVPTGDVVVHEWSPGRFISILSFSTSAVCSAKKKPVPSVDDATKIPPILPEAFFGNFTEFNAYSDTLGPPYVNGIPPAPFIGTRGAVYYDWSRKAMIEFRYDYCVNIFPTGNEFPCTFHNVNGVSYLITYNHTTAYPPCCVFGDPWYPPEPAFLRQNVTSVYKGEHPWSMSEADWFEIPSIQPPTGPFFYSFNRSLPTEEHQTYLSFSFPGMEGWVQQNFYNIKKQTPPESIWQLPGICLPVETLPNCGFFSSSSSSGSD